MSDHTRTRGENEKFCESCGAVIRITAEICPKCGVRLTVSNVPLGERSQKSRMVAFLLCTFLGVIGVHRFYVGKVVSGIFTILTFGGFGVWTFVDWIVILVGKFKDVNGKRIVEW